MLICHDLCVYLSRLSRFVLDVSALKGGAPGRTRGLNLYAVDTFANGVDGMKQL